MTPKFKIKLSFKNLLKNARDLLKHKRSKASLIRLDTVNRESGNPYKRPPQSSRLVEDFYEKVSVDIPYKKTGSQPKKVLTEKLWDVYIWTSGRKITTWTRFHLPLLSGGDLRTYYWQAAEDLSNVCVRDV